MRARRTGSARAWAVWAVGATAYAVAVLHRSSFGVAGLAAGTRFGASPAVLSAFTSLQLGVYAAGQIPAGLLLDRFGARRTIAAGAFGMAAGQLVLATAGVVPVAVAGRVLVGFGDALTFVSVLRLLPAWFGVHRVPLLTQLTAQLGQLGQVASALAVGPALVRWGWTPTFLATAAVGVLAGVAVLAAVRDTPSGPLRPAPAGSATERGRSAAGDRRGAARRVGRDVADAWRLAGVRLGLWAHFTTQFPATVFLLAWGYPYLVVDQHRPPAVAGALLTGCALTGAAVAPLIGTVSARRPELRLRLVVAVVAANAGAWTAVLAWPGRVPLLLLGVLVLALASGYPGAMVGFDLARAATPEARLGTASGLVNVGGFVAALTAIAGVGLVLQWRPGDFTAALAVQYPLWLLGLALLWHARRRAGRGG